MLPLRVTNSRLPVGCRYQSRSHGVTQRGCEGLRRRRFVNQGIKDEPVSLVIRGGARMDTFWGDPHVVLAMYCIAVALFLTVIVQAEVIADYYQEVRSGARRGKKWWQK